MPVIRTRGGVQVGCRPPTDDERQQIEEAVLEAAGGFEGGVWFGVKRIGAVEVYDIRKQSRIDATGEGVYEADDGEFAFRLVVGPGAGLDFWGFVDDMPERVDPEPPETRLVPRVWTHMSWWIARNTLQAEQERIVALYDHGGRYDDYHQPGGGQVAKARAEARELAGQLGARIGTAKDWERAAKLGFDGSGTLEDAHRKDGEAAAGAPCR